MSTWASDAACTGQTDLFFPHDEERPGERYRRENEAKAICAGCPVIEPCLQSAIDGGERGIWGGTNERERDEMIRRSARKQERTRLAIPISSENTSTHPGITWSIIETRPDLSGVDIRLLLAESNRNWHGFQFAVHRGDSLVFLADDEAEAWIYFNTLVMA